MVFSSILFIFLFLPAVLTVFFLLPKKIRYGFLLLANLFFYAWGEGRYVLLLIFFIIANYFFGILITSNKNKKRAKTWLIISIVFNLGILIFYKYGFFLGENLKNIFSFLGLDLNISFTKEHLPIGVSFFTFQAISYVIDVYRNEVSATKNLFNFALYKSFFPQLIAGPIIRYKDVSSQFHSKPDAKADDFLIGVQRFIIGLGKKVLIANTVATVADQIFSLSTDQLRPETAWLGAICYTVQIYFDFSGYSDMAIGLARMFGFKFLENFNYPYIASSIQDFWRRWHISLSSWFRDYLYIPLGGNRCSLSRVYLNQMIVFILCGLWHGASWTFVIWGAWHGLFIILEKMKFGEFVKKIGKPFSNIYTLIIVIVGWVIFRANTFAYAFEFIKTMFGFGDNSTSATSLYYFLNTEIVVILIISIFASMPIMAFFRNHFVKSKERLSEYKITKWSYVIAILFIFYTLIFFLSIASLASGTYNPFIYFRF